MKKQTKRKTTKSNADEHEVVPKLKEVLINSLSDPISQVLRGDKSTVKYAVDRLFEAAEKALESDLFKKLEDCRVQLDFANDHLMEKEGIIKEVRL